MHYYIQILQNSRAFKIKKTSKVDSNNLSEEPLVVTIIQQEVDKVNINLPPWEQIKKYQLLPQPLSIERGELTPKMSVRRQTVSNSYADLIEKIYMD